MNIEGIKMKKRTIKDLECLTADDYFTQEEKKLFLAIPHRVENHGKVIEYCFDVPENGEYPVLRRVPLLEVLEPISNGERDKYIKLLHRTNHWFNDGQKGLFIQSQFGGQVFDLMKELYAHDRVNGEKLLEEYYTLSVNSDNLTKIESSFVEQVEQMQNYLKKAKIIFTDYKIEYSKYNDLDDKQMEGELKALRKQYGKGLKVEGYNDLDYYPMIIDGHYCIHDVSSQTFFFVKDNGTNKKIYGLSVDRAQLDYINEWLSDFAYDHKQYFVELMKTATPADLIGEIENGKLIKGTHDLLTMDLFQSYIVQELEKKGKIKSLQSDMNFEQLLANYTKQNEVYHIEERSLLPLLLRLEIVDGKLTYEDFRQVKKNIKLEHESIGEHNIKDLIYNISGPDQTPDQHGMRALWIKDGEISNLAKLPEKYKEQINTYLDNLLERDNTEQSQQFVSMLKDQISPPVKKLKIK